MPESTILAGKVRKNTLPLLQGPSGPEAPFLKRLLLPQGELAQFYNSEEPIRYLAYIELRTGAVRANHYHKVKNEFLYVIAGELLLVLEDVESKQRQSVPVQAGDLVFIETGVAHAVRTMQPGHAIEFSRVPFDLADIHRYPLI